MTKRLLILAPALIAAAAASAQSRLDQLDVLHAPFPRVYFFRAAEGSAAMPGISFERWDAAYSRLMGIEGKVLDEEITGRSRRNIDFFSRFKELHPRQLVLEHYNGLGRLPQDAQHWFAGHWLYYNGGAISSDVPAASDDTEIRVSKARMFRLNAGREHDVSEDIGLCELGADGKPDWSKSEQVKLLEVKVERGGAGIIKVRRAQYGTQPRAFTKGRAYAAAHLWNGPWGKDKHLLWNFNLASTCPRDGNGRTCADALADELGRLFAQGGGLEKFDGIQFDVMRHSFVDRPGNRDRDPDCDGDGKADSGFIGDQDVYAEGVVGFCRMLRAKLGPDRLILADGWNWDHVRAFGILNGMESEGWPKLGDLSFADWCGGLNRAAFWKSHSAAPVFNYVNHKAGGDIAKPGKPAGKDSEGNFAYHRLVFAASLFMDCAICSSLRPPVERGQLHGVWDEWWRGRDMVPGWLGMPKGEAVHLGFKSADALQNVGAPPSQKLLGRIESENAALALDEHGLRVTGRDSKQTVTRCHLTVPVGANGELLVRFNMQAGRTHLEGPGVPRLLFFGLVENRFDLSNTWIDEKPMDYSFYATGLPPGGTAKLTFDIEGAEPWWITSLTVHAHPDVMVREFDHGVVLANPSAQPFDFDLDELFPGAKLRRITGTATQDPRTNNGRPAAGKVRIGAKDGLFLVKE
ncbi:MAG: hypothetical protein K1X78_24630 [Verrucomicrobiaceae bacterium]|nr:hypothetical protein [Verrucomicrobiaceae bacterium]